MKDWETMIDRIGTEQDYSRYTPGANLVKRNTESEEKFSLDRQDIKAAEEKTSAEEKADAAESGEKAGAASAKGYVRGNGGVILELSGQEPQENAAKQTASLESGLVFSTILQQTTQFLGRVKGFFAKVWDVIWNSPAEQSTKSESTEQMAGEAVSAEQLAGETVPEEQIPQEQISEEKISGQQKERPVSAEQLRRMQIEKRLEEMLAENSPARNSDLLTYYDRKGNMVQVTDKQRILHGK